MKIINALEDTKTHLIFKMFGTTNLVRMIEWKNLFRSLNPKAGEKILDVACGNGILSMKIAEIGCEVFGIDMSKSSIMKAKHLSILKKISCEFKVEDVEKMSFQDDYFDNVVCSSSLEHFKNDVLALKEMNRVLKPNGKLILTTDSFNFFMDEKLRNIHKETTNVVNYYTTEKINNRFQITGFRLIQSKYLFNSHISNFFFKIGIKLRWSGKIWSFISYIAFPICLISDNQFGVKDKGCTLMVVGRKSNE